MCRLWRTCPDAAAGCAELVHVAETVVEAVEADLAAAAEELTDLERRVEEEAALPPAPARPPPGARRPFLAAAPFPTGRPLGRVGLAAAYVPRAYSMAPARGQVREGAGAAAPCHGPGCVKAS